MDNDAGTPGDPRSAVEPTASDSLSQTPGLEEELSAIRPISTSLPDRERFWSKISPNERQAWIGGGFAIVTAIVGVGTAIYINSSTKTENLHASPRTTAVSPPASSPSPSALTPVATIAGKDDSTVVDLTKCGLAGLREDISPVAVMQRYGFPKNPEQLDYLEYPSFAVGFDDKSQLTHVTFDWKSSAHWKTTTGLGFNATKSDVLKIYGEPKEVLYSDGGSFYYDRFHIEFDSADHISVITLHVRDTSGFTLAAVQREALRLMMVDPDLKKIITEHAEIGTLLAFYSLTLHKSQKDSDDNRLIKEAEKTFPKEAQLVKKRFLSERAR